jgi:hypothetical protein
MLCCCRKYAEHYARAQTAMRCLVRLEDFMSTGARATLLLCDDVGMNGDAAGSCSGVGSSASLRRRGFVRGAMCEPQEGEGGETLDHGDGGSGAGAGSAADVPEGAQVQAQGAQRTLAGVGERGGGGAGELSGLVEALRRLSEVGLSGGR